MSWSEASMCRSTISANLGAQTRKPRHINSIIYFNEAISRFSVSLPRGGYLGNSSRKFPSKSALNALHRQRQTRRSQETTEGLTSPRRHRSDRDANATDGASLWALAEEELDCRQLATDIIHRVVSKQIQH